MQTSAHWGLPEPDSQPAFYENVPTKRFLAWCFDTALILTATVVLLPFTAFLGLLIFPFMMFVVGFLYRWFSLANRSATPGMRFMSLELRDIDGRCLSRNLALKHTIGFTLSFAIFPLQLVSILLMITSSKRQGLTDHILGTAALNITAR